MAYSDFTLKKVKSELKLQIIEDRELFTKIQEATISQELQNTLKKTVPLALAINTEKARSELIIINILFEVKEQLTNTISLFSGIDFNIDKEQGLTGFCDYIFSQSPEQFYLEKPVITIVEAKNENINAGLGQCIAEMYAAQIFNNSEGITSLPYIYGAVTTGDYWKFMQLVQEQVFIDTKQYHIMELNKIVAILIAMLT